MRQFDTVIIKHKQKDYDACYERCVDLGYNKNSIASIHTIDSPIPKATHGNYKNYRNSNHRTDPDFLNFYRHFKAWKLGVQLDKPILIIEDKVFQQFPLPGNINNFYTEILNCSAGNWEYENTILSLPKSDHRIGGDDYPIFERNCLSNSKAYLITPLGCKKALDINVKYGYMIPRVMFNSVLFDVKYFKRKLFV